MPGLEDSGSACTACGAALAPDQRYCVECGQRRGRSDLPFAPVTVEYDDDASADGARPSRWRMSSSSALIGGIGVLLLALGVGVLIGRTGNASASKSTPPVQVVTVAAGASAPAGSGAATPSSSGTAGAAAAGAAGAATAPAAAKAAKATTHVSSATVTSSTVAAIETTRPLTGPNRPGYHNGKFTGNFFGP